MPVHYLDCLVDARDPSITSVPTQAGLRSTAAADYRQALAEELPRYGITRVATLTGFDFLGVPAHMAVRPQGRTLSSGSGKGLTVDGSWVSAVMECIEQSVWEEYAPDVVVGTERSMRATGYAVVDASACAQVQGSQYHPGMPIGWVKGVNLATGLEAWVPEGTVTVSAHQDHRLNPFVSGSNGLASGAHVLEALLSGLLEVIERDGISVHHGDVTSSADRMLQEASPELADLVEKSGLTVRVRDCSTELGIPTVSAYLHDRPGATVGLFSGAGAALDTHVALVRAVIESAQGRSIITAGARDDVFESMRTASLHRVSHVAGPATGVLDHRVSLSTGTIDGDVAEVIGRLTAHGFGTVVAVRMTPPGELVQVVRVVVPGLAGYPFDNAARGRQSTNHQPSMARA